MTYRLFMGDVKFDAIITLHVLTTKCWMKASVASVDTDANETCDLRGRRMRERRSR